MATKVKVPQCGLYLSQLSNAIFASKSGLHHPGVKSLPTAWLLCRRLLCTAYGLEKKREKSREEQEGLEFNHADETQELPVSNHGNEHETVLLAREMLREIKESYDKPTSLDRLTMDDTEIQVNKLSNATPQLLGLSAKKLQSRHDFLTKLGVSAMFALKLSLTIPTPLQIESDRSANMIQVLKKHNISLQRLLVDPHVLSYDSELVDENLIQLKSCGLSERAISDIVNAYPLCLCFPLSPHVRTTTENFFRPTGGENASVHVSNTLKLSLQNVSTEYMQRSNFQEAIGFLSELEIPFDKVLGKCPDFFNCSSSHLWECFDYVSGKPLFFDVESLRDFIARNPEVFISLNKENVQNLIQLIRDVTDDGNRLFYLFCKRTKLFTKPDLTIERIGMFRKWKFSDIEIRKLFQVASSTFLTNRDSLEDRLAYMLSPGDISTSDIVKHTFVLKMRLSVLKWRIGFLRETGIEPIHEYDTETLFQSDEEFFATQICQSTFEKFDDYVQRHSHYEIRRDFLEKRKQKRMLKNSK